MKNLLSITLAAAIALGALPVLASSKADMQLDDAMRAKITAQLTAEGYQVGKIKAEDGMYEAYARKDGKRLEVYLNSDLQIVMTKVDD